MDMKSSLCASVGYLHTLVGSARPHIYYRGFGLGTESHSLPRRHIYSRHGRRSGSRLGRVLGGRIGDRIGDEQAS